MNPSPDARLAELSAETNLGAEHPPTHPELRADWHLKQELGQLPTPDLPPALRARIMAQTTHKHRRRAPPHWLGLAAALVLALGLVWFQQIDRHDAESGQIPVAITETDLRELQLALATLDESARQTGRIAGRELGAPFSSPLIQLDELPLVPRLRHWTQPLNRTASDNQNHS